MTLRHASFFLALALGVPALAAGCSSDDSSGSSSGNYEPAGNGVPTGESEACTSITKAEDARRNALGCGPVTRPSCPGYISAGHEACSQYDQGTVSACEAWIAQQSCDTLKTKKCIVKVLEGTAPNGCTVVDAGSDAETDAGNEAGDDAAPDAPAEASDDGASEAGNDADVDADVDAGDDASDGA
jgi:hypothetical protein